MPQYSRFAVYYAPPEGSALAAFGASWLGWDAAAARETEPPEVSGLPKPAGEITARPRKYGFHGTLKPPIVLADGTDRAGFEAAIDALAARTAPFEMPELAVRALGTFVAVVPTGNADRLRDLATACVTELDRFRAPPGEAELAKRRAMRLTPKQEAMLERWGYPYVLDEFGFHMTLSGSLEPEDQTAVVSALEPHVAPCLTGPLMVREICLFGEAEDGRFHLLRRFALTG